MHYVQSVGTSCIRFNVPGDINRYEPSWGDPLILERLGSLPVMNPFGKRVLFDLSILPVRCWRVVHDRLYHNRIVEDDNVYFVRYQPRKMTWGIPMKKGRGLPVQTKLDVEEDLGGKHYENQPLTWSNNRQLREIALPDYFRESPMSGSCVGVGANPQNVQREAVNHPDHYNANPSGVEAIDVIEHMTFNVGNAVKYLWRADHKGKQIEDLKKARWYIDREIQRLEKEEHEQTESSQADC